MTVQQELRDGAEPQGEERRQPTTRPRISWTSDRPYVVPAAVAGRERTPEEVERFDPVARARTRRARWERPTMGQAVVGDVLIAITLTFVLMVNDQRTLHQSIAGAVGTGILWCVLLLIRRGYDLRRMSEVTAAVQAVAGAAFGAMAVLGFLSYAMKVELPRRYVLVGVPAIAFLTIVHRLMVRHTLKRRRTSGDAMLRTLVAGDGSTAGAFAHELATTKDHGMQVVGMALASLDVVPMTPGSSQVPVWGVLSEIPQMVVDHDIDVVVVTGVASPAIPCGACPGRWSAWVPTSSSPRGWSTRPPRWSRCSRPPVCSCCTGSARRTSWAAASSRTSRTAPSPCSRSSGSRRSW